MTQTKTDAGLLEALKRASSRTLSKKEIDAQRVSFIMGAVDEKSGVTREQVREYLRTDRKLADAQ